MPVLILAALVGLLPLVAFVTALKYCLGSNFCLSLGNIRKDLSDFLSCVGVDLPFIRDLEYPSTKTPIPVGSRDHVVMVINVNPGSGLASEITERE